MNLLQGKQDKTDADQTPRLKILHLIAAPQIGGAERLLLTLADHIDAARFELALGVFVDAREERNDFFVEAQQHGVTLLPIEIKGAFDPGQLFKLLRILRSFRPDVLHAHGYKTNLFAFILARCTEIPVVATVHGWLHSTKKLTRKIDTLNRRLLPYFDQVIAVSSQIEKELLRSGVPAKRLLQLNNVAAMQRRGVNQQPLPERRNPSAASFKMVGFIGRLEPVKGGADFIAAAAEILASTSKVKFVIAGAGSKKQNLQAQVHELGLETQVEFLGFVEDPAALLQQLDVYVLPSLDEGVPLSLLEAMAAGVPVVASRVGGVPEVIEAGVNGLLVPPRRPDLLAEAIKSCLDNPLEAEQRAGRAKQTVARDFSLERWIGCLQALYQELSQAKTATGKRVRPPERV